MSPFSVIDRISFRVGELRVDWSEDSGSCWTSMSLEKVSEDDETGIGGGEVIFGFVGVVDLNSWLFSPLFLHQ